MLKVKLFPFSNGCVLLAACFRANKNHKMHQNLLSTRCDDLLDQRIYITKKVLTDDEQL